MTEDSLFFFDGKEMCGEACLVKTAHLCSNSLHASRFHDCVILAFALSHEGCVDAKKGFCFEVQRQMRSAFSQWGVQHSVGTRTSCRQCFSRVVVFISFMARLLEPSHQKQITRALRSSTRDKFASLQQKTIEDCSSLAFS